MKNNILACAILLAILSVPILTRQAPPLPKDNAVISLRGLSDKPIEAIVKTYGKPINDYVYPMKDNGMGGEMSVELYNYYSCFPVTKTPTGNEDVQMTAQTWDRYSHRILVWFHRPQKLGCTVVAWSGTQMCLLFDLPGFPLR